MSLITEKNMKKTTCSYSVTEATDTIKNLLQEKGFTIFSDIDHQANAQAANLTMPASRLLVFGNPIAGTQLMLKDITTSLNLPLQLAIVDEGGKTFLLHNATDDLRNHHQLEDHPILEKIDGLFTTIEAAINN